MTELFGGLITLIAILFWIALAFGGIIVVGAILSGIGIGIMAIIQRLK